MYSCEWCTDIKEFRKTAINQSAGDLHTFLKGEAYEYLVIDARTVRKFGENKTNEEIQELVESNLFKPIHQQQGILVFSIT